MAATHRYRLLPQPHCVTPPDECDGDTLTAKRTRSSKRPLSLGELIEVFLAP